MENAFILRAPQGANKKKVIVGRGRSSGAGGTSCRGNKGQNSRSGGGVRLGFEGGQTPLFRRLPSRGFSNEAFKLRYTIVNLAILETIFPNDSAVNYKTLLAKGVVKTNETLIKILGNGVLTKKLIVQVDRVSKSAKVAIEKAGGQVLASTDQNI